MKNNFPVKTCGIEKIHLFYTLLQFLFQGLDQAKEHTPTLVHSQVVRLHLCLELVSVKR